MNDCLIFKQRRNFGDGSSNIQEVLWINCVQFTKKIGGRDYGVFILECLIAKNP